MGIVFNNPTKVFAKSYWLAKEQATAVLGAGKIVESAGVPLRTYLRALFGQGSRQDMEALSRATHTYMSMIEQHSLLLNRTSSPLSARTQHSSTGYNGDVEWIILPAERPAGMDKPHRLGNSDTISDTIDKIA